MSGIDTLLMGLSVRLRAIIAIEDIIVNFVKYIQILGFKNMQNGRLYSIEAIDVW